MTGDSWVSRYSVSQGDYTRKSTSVLLVCVYSTASDWGGGESDTNSASSKTLFLIYVSVCMCARRGHRIPWSWAASGFKPLMWEQKRTCVLHKSCMHS